MAGKNTVFLGYRRDNGSVGVRNLVAVMSVMDNSNPIARHISQRVLGTVPICATFGRVPMGQDIDVHRRTLVGLAMNPNISAVVICSIEPKTAQAVADEISSFGKPVGTCVIQSDGGTVGATEKGIRLAGRFSIETSSITREPCELSDLVVGLECGGSDSTSGIAGNTVTGLVADRIVEAGGTVIVSEPVEILGAEHILARRARDKDVAKRLLGLVQWCEDYAKSLGQDLTGSNPAPDNIEGGLTTIEEKSLGALKKAGSSTLEEVVGYAVRPSKKGLIFMNGPAPAVENLTGLAAAGSQLIMFYTGKGNHSGNPVAPVIKSCGNPETLKIMPENIDLDLSAIIFGEMDLPNAGNVAMELLLQVASGRFTAAEVLHQSEIAISRFALEV
jgi:altronate dehydratase large subunit